MAVYLSLLVVVLAHFFGHIEIEAADGHFELRGNRGVPLPHIGSGVGVVNDDAFALLKSFSADLLALFYCFQSVIVDSHVVAEVVLPERAFAASRAAAKDNHFLLFLRHFVYAVWLFREIG